MNSIKIKEFSHFIHRLITFIIITTFLCQDIAFAKGPGMLMPESKASSIAALLGIDPTSAWRVFQDPAKIQNALAVLTLDELARLKEFLQENNWDDLPDGVRKIFARLLGQKLPTVKKQGSQPSLAEETPNIKELNRLKAMILEKVRVLNGARPLWMSIYGDSGTGKTELAKIMKEGVGDIKPSEIKIIDDNGIFEFVFSGRSVSIDCKLVVVVALGNDAFDIQRNYDVNVYMFADKETKIKNMETELARMYPTMTVDERERSIQSILKADEEDIDGFRDTKTKPDFVLDMSKDKRPSFDEMREVFGGKTAPDDSAATDKQVLSSDDFQEVLGSGIRILKEEMGGGKTLYDRVIFTATDYSSIGTLTGKVYFGFYRKKNYRTKGMEP